MIKNQQALQMTTQARKHKLQPAPPHPKRLRSKIARRKIQNLSENDPEFGRFPAISSSSTSFSTGLSCTSSLTVTGNQSQNTKARSICKRRGQTGATKLGEKYQDNRGENRGLESLLKADDQSFCGVVKLNQETRKRRTTSTLRGKVAGSSRGKEKISIQRDVFSGTSCSEIVIEDNSRSYSKSAKFGEVITTRVTRSALQKREARNSSEIDANRASQSHFLVNSSSGKEIEANSGRFSKLEVVSEETIDQNTRSTFRKEATSASPNQEENGGNSLAFSGTSYLEPEPKEVTKTRRRLTFRKISEENSSKIYENGLELSDTSCLQPSIKDDSLSFTESESFCRDTTEENTKFQRNAGKFTLKLPFSGEKVAAKWSPEREPKDFPAIAFSDTFCLDSIARTSTRDFSESHHQFRENFLPCPSESTIELIKEDSNSDLACSEHLSSVDSACRNGIDSPLYLFESRNFLANFSGKNTVNWDPGSPCPSYAQFSSSPSFSSVSSDFSECMATKSSSHSETFSLFLKYTEELPRFRPNVEYFKAGHGGDFAGDFKLSEFAESAMEESYMRFRYRERREVFLHNYVQQHRSTDYGDLIRTQRSLLVNWIVQRSKKLGLQWQTLFLSVNLLDRFLCKAVFKTESRLQILGIACATLATRLEENQPLNSVRQKTFQVGSNVYNRCEVVAMEWVVQKVLCYRCLLPTTLDFLWFYLKAAGADAEIEVSARNLAVLSLGDQELLGYWPSTIAAALVILACLAADYDQASEWVIETHIRSKSDDLAECIQSLEWLVEHTS
ncbi:uncharacterized protein LOC18421708 isoform X1 [Amborella trichopoda]|uniref:uncharacterized protein LOC18421708 isoform X1 n=1 Tax=Amborella trichopoda TaxID=13333 RepID=UPI0005D3C339|nr:uncharacterized protein LOC18421708 isoform X1 [Amborella trichopoda]|eukprot:XP_006826577.2 uncharacterized protein LOC18421708 isoform X1 [Amborella trichopoda]